MANFHKLKAVRNLKFFSGFLQFQSEYFGYKISYEKLFFEDESIEIQKKRRR